jgi:Ion channel
LPLPWQTGHFASVNFFRHLLLDADYSHLGARLSLMHDSQNKLILLFKEYPFGVLLASLMLTIVGAPLATKFVAFIPGLHGQTAIAPLVLVLTLAAAYAILSSARSRATSIFLGGLVVTFLCLSTLLRHDSLTAINLVAQMAFLTYVIFVVVRVVFRASLVDGNILCGAASLYLMIGVLIGFIYSLIELLNPGSFTIVEPAGQTTPSPSQVHAGWLIYFSLTTLTTVSMGDMVPSTDIARSMVVLEAIIGQMLIVLMMARIVGLHVAQVSSGRDKPVAFEISETPRPRSESRRHRKSS